MTSKGRIQTPLAKARGLGSAGHGSAHWFAERLTSLALIPLTLWLVYSILSLIGADHATFTLWLSQPVNAIAMILFVVVGFYHAMLGCQVIVEDYVHCECAKLGMVIGIKFGFYALIVASVFCILKVAL